MLTDPAPAHDSSPPQNRIHPPHDYRPQAGDVPPEHAAVPKLRGNPDLNLAPRCGALTRAGCPCLAPAIHGKLRCRMHGGRSTGPRTPEGRARVAAARTTHGDYGASKRAFYRHHVTFMRRGRLHLSAIQCYDRLPPEFAARMALFAPELQPPPRPTLGITRAEDRAMQQAETAALAPWKLAVALARQARRADRAARAELCGALATAQAGPGARDSVPLPLSEGIGERSPCLPTPRGTNPSPQPWSASRPEPSRGGGVSTVAAVLPAAQAEPLAPIRLTPAQAAPQQTPAQAAPQQAPARGAPQQAPGSSVAQVAAKPHAPNGAARRASRDWAPASVGALPKAHAPIHSAAARPASEPVAVRAGAAQVAGPHAPERALHGTNGAEEAAVPDDAAAEPHAPDGRRARRTGVRCGAAVPIAPHAAKPHAPVAAAAVAPPRTDNAAVRRSAAQWRDAQRKMRR